MQEGPTINYEDGSGVHTYKGDRAFYADPELLSMFTLPLVAGDEESALRQPKTLLLTESTAEKYFGSENPIGKTLSYASFWLTSEYTVAGVVQDLPGKSHFQFDILLPMQDIEAVTGPADQQFNIMPNVAEISSYVELHPDADINPTAQKLTDVLNSIVGSNLQAMNATVTVGLQPLEDIYFDTATTSTLIEKGNPAIVSFFTVIALIILTIALINYINLATARAVNRAKEVGIRKVVGADRGQLIQQFLTESVFTSLLALIIGFVIAAQVMPLINNLFQTRLTVDAWMQPQFLRVFAGVFTSGILLSGLGPAFMLSSFQPVSILKGKISGFGSQNSLRRGLVILQFAGTIALITCTGIVFSQLDFIRGFDVGFDMEQILVTTGPRVFPEEMDGTAGAETALRNRVLELPEVEGAAFSGSLAGQGYVMSVPAWLSGRDVSSAREIGVTAMDHRFAELYGLEVLAGEPFVEGTPSWFTSLSTGSPAHALINEAAVRALGLQSNEEAIGQIVLLNENPYVVHGVLKDVSWSSLHQATSPILFRYNLNNRFLSIKVNSTDTPGTVAAIGAIYTELFPYDLFQYEFADEAYNAQYQNDERFGVLFGVFAALTILIGCLGLFGLVAFAAERRTKEIGIRKVLGASVQQIVGMLSREFVILVLVANVLAWPVAWYAMNRWLQNFAYRIDLSWWIFVLAGALALVIALATVSTQAIKAATANPVDSLRYE
ncbi:hypothetical protein ES703_69281 [subsurface metagenome]